MKGHSLSSPTKPWPTKAHPAADMNQPTHKEETFIGGALAALLLRSGRVMAKEKERNVPNNPFIVLLAGLYHAVVHGPLGQLG